MRRLLLAAVLLVGCGSDPENGAWQFPQEDASNYDVQSDAAPPPDAPATDASHDAPTDALHFDSPGESSADVSVDSPPDAWLDGCPPEMARIDSFCVDRYEAFVVEIDGQGNESPHSPYYVIDDGVAVRAHSQAGVVPQGYISQVQASEACDNAGKRLCSADEFTLACKGPDPSNWYPYGGQQHEPGYCNEGKGSTVALFYGSDPSKWTYADFNDPQLNQWDGGLAVTGAFTKCVSPYGVHDCVGNLHEWGDDPADAKGHGRFRGGFYGDAEINGHGCLYVTSAHELNYHDYSTGFRCCMDAKQ